MSSSIQQQITSLLQQSLALNEAILGTQCYNDLLGLFQAKRLQLKKLPTDMVYTNNLLTFSGEVQSVADSTTTSPVLSQSSFQVSFCLFDDTDGDRQAVLLLNLPAYTYLENSQAPIGQTSGPESLFDLYATADATGMGTQMVYSSLTSKDLTGTAYADNFNTAVAQANLKAGLNFPLSFTLNSDFALYFVGLLVPGVTATNLSTYLGTINGFGEVSLRENALQALSKETALTIPDASATPLLSTPYLSVYQDLTDATLYFPPGSTSSTAKLSVTLSNIGLGFPLADNDSIWPEVFLDGSVTIGSGSSAVTLDIEAAYFLYHGVLGLKFTGFPTLKQLLSSFGTPSDYFQAPFDKILDIDLSDLEILIDIQSKSILEINLTVAAEESIEIIEGIVSIKPTLTLQIQNPFDSTSRTLEGLFSATWELGSTTFDTYLTYPNFDFEAKLAAGQTLDVSTLADKVLNGITLPEIDITAMEVHGNFTQKSFAFSLTIDSDLTIPLLGGNVLTIEQVEMGMGYSAGQRTYELIGKFDLAGALIYVSADYDGQNWQFQGSSYPDTTIHFSDLFKALPGNNANGPAVSKIIANFPSLEIDAINFSYNTGDKSFEIGVTAAVNIDNTSYPFSFSVAREKKGDSFTWKITGKSAFQTPIALGTLFSDFIGKFKFAKDLTLPDSLKNDLNIQSLSFSYDTSTEEFDCGFTLSETSSQSSSISTILGKDIKSSAPPAHSEQPTPSTHGFSKFTLKRTDVSGVKTTSLNIKIDKGLNLFNLVGLGSDLPKELNFTLDEIDFTITLSDAHGNSDSSTKYAFSTTFEDNDGHSFNFIGVYEGIKNTTLSGSPETKSFGGTIYSSDGNALSIGGGFPIQGGIKDLFIAKVSIPAAEKGDSTKVDTTAYTVFGSDLSAHADIDLAKLPVIGEFLTEAKFNFKSLRFVYAKASLTKSGSTKPTPLTKPIPNGNLSTINTFLTTIDVAPLHTPRSTTNTTSSPEQTFGLGFTLQGSLVLGDNEETIPLHTNFSSTPKPTPAQPNEKKPISPTQVSPSSATSPKSPTPVGKKFGPVTIKKVSLGLSGGKVEITFTGGITMGPLTLDFIDLEVKSPVNKFDPSISLQGMGIDIKKPPLTLEGLFMESTIDIPVKSYELSTASPTQLKLTNGATTVTNQSYLTFTVDIHTSETPKPQSIPLVITNTNSATPLKITSIKCAGKDFAMSALTFPITLSGSSLTETFHVIFSPLKSGLKEGSIIIESDDATVPKFEITLKGNQSGTAPSTVKTIPVTAYNGSLSIGYKNYSLTAIGSYAKLPDNTISTFLYGFLGAPLGGPPFFLITGVAAGFGYNRAFTLPKATAVNTYPLIQPVMPDAGGSFDFASMNLLFMPEKGDFWGAVGIRGTTFKMVESFVMLDVQFKEDIEIDIIGLSHMQFPKPPDDNKTAPGLAKINVGLVARIIPEMGIVSVTGAFLSGSYVMNPLAHISGGFALLGIFKDQDSGQWKGGEAGDFVITIGGYASNYHPKSYYPKVARLEMNWQVSSILSLKASAYFAITPQAMMAGGNLVANLQIGGAFSIHANFTIGADFIIWWKPYHYAAAIYVDLDVSVSIHLLFIHASLSLDLGANLNIYGPDFSGNGSVHVHVLVSFSVNVSFGDGASKPPPIPWSEFKHSLLPIKKNTTGTEVSHVISGNISQGLVPSQSSPEYNVVNPKELQITCESAIPIKTITIIGTTWTQPKNLSISETYALPSQEQAGGTWTTLNPDIVSISGSTVTALKAGTATVQYCKNAVVINSYVINVQDQFGIKPMALTPADITESELKITITNTTLTEDSTGGFIFEQELKNMPAAIWKPAETTGTIPDQSGPHLLKNLISGIKISAKPPTKSTHGFLFDLADADVILTMPEGNTVGSFTYGSTGFSTSTQS